MNYEKRVLFQTQNLKPQLSLELVDEALPPPSLDFFENGHSFPVRWV